MDDDVVTRRQRARAANYKTDENLQRRANIFSYRVAAATPQPVLSQLFDWPDSASVLDLGCGNGIWAAPAARRTQSGMVVGLDISTGMLGAFGQRLPALPRVCADAHRLPLRDGSFDVVVAAWMLYHLVDKPAALSEICRVLRPAGRLIVATNSGEAMVGLDEAVRASLEDTLGHAVSNWIEPLDFTLENGEDILRPWFRSVERFVNEMRFEVPEVGPLLSFVDSVREPMVAEVGDFDYEQFRAALEGRLTGLLSAGPIRFSRRTAFFVSRTAAK